MCLKVMTLFLEVFIEYCQYFFFFFVFNVYANWFSPSSAASSFFHAHFYAFHSGVTSPTSPLYLVSALYIIKVRFFNCFLKFFVVFFFSFAAGHRTFGFLVFSCKEISLSFLFRKKKKLFYHRSDYYGLIPRMICNVIEDLMFYIALSSSYTIFTSFLGISYL